MQALRMPETCIATELARQNHARLSTSDSCLFGWLHIVEVPCFKLDLCQSQQTPKTLHNFSTASIRQKDLSYEPDEAWTLHLPSDCCLLEKLLTVHPFI